jgi:hypothetical protein
MPPVLSSSSGERERVHLHNSPHECAELRKSALDRISCQLTLRAIQNPRWNEAGPIVLRLGQSDSRSTARLRRILRAEVTTYPRVKADMIALVIFVFAGDSVPIGREELEWALLTPSGIFMPDRNDQYQNTRVSAVVYVW